MSKQTTIQWCDSTINPIMGCLGCELFPPPAQILAGIDRCLGGVADWKPGTSRRIYQKIISRAYDQIPSPQRGHSDSVSTTNIWQLRAEFLKHAKSLHGRAAATQAGIVIGELITCYAAKIHMVRGQSILDPSRKGNSGYAPAFEITTRFPGRTKLAAHWKDLRGTPRDDKPWLDGLPRHIFVSDMGDAFSRESDFGFLKDEVIEPIRSEAGCRHVWLWLTKRPERMAGFGAQIGGFPGNVIAMTTLTGPDKLDRVGALRRVPSARRGLSIEPLRERIPAASLDLTGIDWVIVGGESGRKDCVRPFDLAWARELLDHCRHHDVAFFLKQLGRRPVANGREIQLRDGHGGDWDEWPEDMRVRQMPANYLP